MLSFLLLVCCIAAVSATYKPDYVLRVSRQTISADCTSVDAVVVNGTSPGPVVRLTAGEKAWIRVYNDLAAENTTMHWHGLSQYLSPFSDGTPMTSQFPIPPNGYFDYEFAPEKGSEGTYFYHSHVEFQTATAHGALIVEHAKEDPMPYQYDDDLILLVSDYYHKSDHNITTGLLAAPLQWLGDPGSVTFNGNAYGVCNTTTSNCTAECHQEVLQLKPDTMYRLRIISATALTFNYAAIEGHSDMTLIEVNAAYVKPHNVSFFQFNSGQRISLLFKSKSAAELRSQTSFWGRSDSRWRATQVPGSFLLDYSSSLSAVPADASQAAPATLSETVPLPDNQIGWVEHALQPFSDNDPAPADEEVSRRIIVDFQQIGKNPNAFRWYIDNQTDIAADLPSTAPYLVAAYTGQNVSFSNGYEAALQNNGFINHTIPIKIGEVVDFVLISLAATSGQFETHPFHFHGQHPFLIASGTGNFTVENYRAAVARRKQAGGIPFRTDTETVFSSLEGASSTNSTVATGSQGGWTVFRLKAEVAGAFFLHCHTTYSLNFISTASSYGNVICDADRVG